MNILNASFDEQLSILHDANEIVLYGKTVMRPIIESALIAFGIIVPIRVFDSGVFVDGGEITERKRVIILCGLRAKTQESMNMDAAVFFPGALVLKFYTLYYGWLTRIVKRNCDYKVLADTMIATQEEKTIHNIDAINTTFCNLNCKECSNGIQYRKDKKQVPIDEHIAYLTKLTEVLPISYCNFQGGEALTDKNFSELLRQHARNPRIAVLTVATNGGILPDAGVMGAMKETGAMFRISDYGCLSDKKNEIIELSAQYNVPCELYPRAEEWVVYGELAPRGRKEEENRKIPEKCFFGTKDLMFSGDKFFCCCRTLFADACGFDADAVRANTLQLNRDFTKRELEVIIKGENLHLMCDYCDFPMRIVAPAEQMQRR